MHDIPEKPIRPPKITNYSMDINQPGPFKPEKRQVDYLEEAVGTAEQKKKRAQEMSNRLTKIEKQLYGTDTGYGRDTAEHELAHALADDKKGRKGRFRLIHSKGDIIPGYETIGKRTPKEIMKIRSAPSEMSSFGEVADIQGYDRAKLDLRNQRIRIATIAIVGTPLCGGLIYLATQIIK